MQSNHPAPRDLQEFSSGRPSREVNSLIHAYIEECEECLAKVCEMMRGKKKPVQKEVAIDSPRPLFPTSEQRISPKFCYDDAVNFPEQSIPQVDFLLSEVETEV